MPKSQDPGPPRPMRGPHDPAGPPPERAEVERAIQAIVDRLKPKAGRPKPDRKTGRLDARVAAEPSAGSA